MTTIIIYKGMNAKGENKLHVHVVDTCHYDETALCSDVGSKYLSSWAVQYREFWGIFHLGGQIKRGLPQCGFTSPGRVSTYVNSPTIALSVAQHDEHTRSSHVGKKKRKSRAIEITAVQ